MTQRIPDPQPTTDRPAPKYVGAGAIPLAEEQPPPLAPAEHASEHGAVPLAGAALTATRQSVVTSDGYEIGHVKEVSPTHLKVDVPMRRDLWLDANDVAEAKRGIVIMTFPREELEAHTVDEPGPGDALLSSGEQFEQRRKMEDELAHQRADLPPGASNEPENVQ